MNPASKTETIHWSFDPRNPIIPPGKINGPLDAKRAGAAHIFQMGDVYYLYYWGTGADGANRICVASCPVERPNEWTPLGSVLEAQPDTEHNRYGPSFPFVVPRDDGPWLMYFGAWGVPTPERKLPNTTCLALSDDRGKTWRHWGRQPVLPLDKPYDKSGTGSVCVLREKTGFRMYYTSLGEYVRRPDGVQTAHGEIIPTIGIGYAESEDGIHWTKPLKKLMVEPRGFGTEPYEYVCSKPWILREGAGYRMYVHTLGTAYRVRSLLSRDGLHWTWQPSGLEGEMGVGEQGAFDDRQRCYVCVVRHGDQLRCWYTGNGFGSTGMGYATADVKKPIESTG